MNNGGRGGSDEEEESGRISGQVASSLHIATSNTYRQRAAAASSNSPTTIWETRQSQYERYIEMNSNIYKYIIILLTSFEN